MQRFDVIFAIALITFGVPSMTTLAGHPQSAAKTTAMELSDGEVKKIDKDAVKITIKHGPIKNLDMPGMTMVFRLTEPGMLDHVKAGDKVKFRAEKTGGAYTVTEIDTAK